MLEMAKLKWQNDLWKTQEVIVSIVSIVLSNLQHVILNCSQQAGIKKWGTDEETFITIFTTRSFPQLKAMLPEYKKVNTKFIACIRHCCLFICLFVCLCIFWLFIFVRLFSFVCCFFVFCLLVGGLVDWLVNRLVGFWSVWLFYVSNFFERAPNLTVVDLSKLKISCFVVL